MAGTPDRSDEQKETPGEDPRLAVARDKPAASTGVDQATAVFSVRPTEPEPTDEPGDDRLRAAVAAWVSGGAPEDAAAVPAAREDGSAGLDEPSPGSAAEPAAGEAGDAGAAGNAGAADGAGGPDDADDADGSDAEADAGAVAEPVADAAGATDGAAESDDSAGPDADAAGATDGAEDATADAADAAAEDGDAETRAEAEADTDPEAAASAPGTEAAADSAAEPEPEAESDAEAARKAAAKPASDAEVVPEPGAAASTEPDAEPKAAPVDDEPVAAAAAEADATSKGEAKPETDAETKSDAKPSAAAEAESAPKAAGKPASDAEVVPEREAAASAEPDAEPKAAPVDDEPVADAAPVAEAAAKTDAAPVAEAAAKTDAAPKDEPKPTPGAESEAKPEAKAEAAPKDAEPKSAAKPEAKADAESDAAPESGSKAPTSGDATPEAKPDAKPDTKSDAKPGGDSEDGAKPSESKPEAPAPAPKGKSDQPAAKPGVDQATAVFRAVAPPQVDQPTTMLKSPAAQAKADAKPQPKPQPGAEAGSTFVPLKRDDEPKPEPKPLPEAPERTTQQPLPPKPPLDLLAELTNTPPPPETGVRTAVRRVKIWTPLVILLIIVFAIVQAVRPLPSPTLALTAQETVKFDGAKPDVPWPTQGQAAMDVNGIGTFGTSGEQKPVPIASIAKVMTVYLILRDHPIKTGADTPKIPVDAAAQKHYETGKAEHESVVKVTEGQQISEYEALQAVMLPSANNIAKLLARWDTGSSSEDEFVAKMNKTAKELGMKNTHYTDPSGLDKTTVSTAEDLVKLARAAMENATFRDIARQPQYTDLNGDKQNNFFGLVPTVAIGIKTGTTTAAGGNILFAAEKEIDGKRQVIIGAALGQFGQAGVANIDEVTGVVRGLIQSGQQALTAKKIVRKGEVVGRVEDGLGGTVPVVATKDVSAVGWSGLTVKLELDRQQGKEIPHEAKAGTEVGVLKVGDGKNDAVEVPVALQSDLSEPGFGAKIKRIS